MSQPASRDSTPTEVTTTGRIDLLCDQFEKACQAGKPPLIEEMLLQSPPGDRDRLLGELLEIELDFRQRSGSFLQVDDYRGRFPESANLIENVFRRVVKTRRLGDYELLEELGRGGMGVVYKARQIYLNQTVALKILPHRYLDDTQAVSRFRREMQLIGGLNHPNIVRAYNAGETGGVNYLVMEFVDGVNLQQFIGSHKPPGGPIGVGAACEIIRQAALGLEHAHEHQLVHRDIKPANLMLCRDGQVKLLDMGLARFHAEWRGAALGQEGLTQPGMTMGTIDYMAPEQWENSSTADIRSDIYSLGCTLYYLLTGKTPYADPAFDTGRKKLMAHVVAPIPSLIKVCPECPRDLEEIYETMLAKDPRERYANPAEVAEAIADFADAEELAEVVALIPNDPNWLAASNVTLHGPDVDTAKPGGAPSLGSNAFRRVLSRRIARQKRRRIQLALVASLIAGLAGLLVWMRPWTGDKEGKPSANTADSSAANASKEDSLQGESAATGAATFSERQIASDLALLPGLNGAWWFEETPWLMPFLRETIAAKVLASAPRQAMSAGGSAQAGRARARGLPDRTSVLGIHPMRYFNTNTVDVYAWLWEAAGRCRGDLSPAQIRLVDQLKAFSEVSHDGDANAARALDDARQQFEDGHRDGAWTAADLHAVALLRHRVAVLDNDVSQRRDAKAAYDKALKAYSAERNLNVSTRLLCLVDSAFLCSDVLGDTQEAKQRIDEVLPASDLPVFFHVSVLVARGTIAAASARNPGEYEDFHFTHAKAILTKAEKNSPNHPLAAHPLSAYVAERYAWSLLDQWKVHDASEQFQAARNIRWINKEDKIPLAEIFLLQDRNGSAIAARYRGDLDSARRNYRTIIEEIKAAQREAQRPGNGAQAGYVRALRDRMSNSLERWADCDLYSGAASDENVNLAQAADSYEQARKTALQPSDAAAMGYKQAIVLALNDKTPAAREIIAALDADKRPFVEPSKERVELVRQVAHAILAVKGPMPADGFKLLRAFLDQFKLNQTIHDSSRRETMELQLFAAETLLSRDLERTTKLAPRDLRSLDALLAVFKDHRDVLPFLRRYYELAVRACNKNDLVQIAHYLIESRMDQRKDPQATLLLFSFTPKENFAIFLPRDGRPGRRFALDITREQIKASKRKPLRLNDELVGLIHAEIAAGRRVELFWDDSASRQSEDQQDITDRDWPFDQQIELAKLETAAKQQ